MSEHEAWVVVTNVRMERRAMQGLKDRGFMPFCPMRVVEFRVGPRRHRACRLSPGLPGYLLVERRGSWHGMIGVDGVRGVLAINWEPLIATPVEVERLRRQFSLEPVPIVEDAYKIGAHLRVTTGAFEGFDAVIERIGKAGRLVVLTSVMGQVSRIDLDRQHCEVLCRDAA